MTVQGVQAAAAWRDGEFARTWAEGDTFRDLLEMPRQLAAGITDVEIPWQAFFTCLFMGRKAG